MTGSLLILTPRPPPRDGRDRGEQLVVVQKEAVRQNTEPSFIFLFSDQILTRVNMNRTRYITFINNQPHESIQFNHPRIDQTER
jgi:hypothetical protein